MVQVKLKPEFDNDMVFNVAGSRVEGGEIVVSLFPEDGGMLCAANIDNLEVIHDT